MRKETMSAFEDVVDIRFTRGNLAALLSAYYGAVALDQARADERHNHLGSRNKMYWRGYRKDHLRQLRLLLDTLSSVSKKTLAKITVLAATRKPSDVRTAVVEVLSWGAFAEVADERLYEAPDFFETLIKEIGYNDQMPKAGKGSVQKMMRWLDPVDPLQIAHDLGALNSLRRGRVRSRVTQL